MNIEYTKVGDYLLPNLIIENQNYEQINKYGYLRLNYIKEHKKRMKLRFIYIPHGMFYFILIFSII